MRGLPGQLEKETYEALRAIFIKYLNMKKRHLKRNYIIGIMYLAFHDAIRDEKKERR